jgi:hypothetical protein
MALCHDERDHALGFSRYNPSAGRRRVLREQKNQASLKRREAYIAALTPARRRAYHSVKFCLVAIGRFFEERGEMVHIPAEDLHRLFPDFARAIGLRGPLYRMKDGSCPAVKIYLWGDAPPKDSKKKSFWFINPYLHHSHSSASLKRKVARKRTSEAAREFCRAWLPDWNWK